MKKFSAVLLALVLPALPSPQAQAVSPPPPNRLVVIAASDDGAIVRMSENGGGYRDVVAVRVDGVDATGFEVHSCTDAAQNYALVGLSTLASADVPDRSLTRGYYAVVRLSDGRTTVLDLAAPLTYQTLGCGLTGTAIVADATLGTSTRLWSVDMVTGSIVDTLQLSQAEVEVKPTVDGFVSSAGRSVSFHGSAGTTVVPTTGVPTSLVPQADGSVVFLEVGADSSLSVARATRDGLVDETSLGAVGTARLIQTAGTPVLSTLAGSPRLAVGYVKQWRTRQLLRAASTAGDLAITSGDGGPTTVTVKQGSDEQITNTTSTVVPAAEVVRIDAASAEVTAVAPTTSPCAVDRNDPSHQVYQPSTSQIEWAVDRAVKGQLTTPRPANWDGHGLPSYSPQGLIPYVALDGGGTIPPEILLAVLAQESNLKQASYHAPRGMYGNPLIADYYGSGGTPYVDYTSVDCGYGLGQITTGMKLADTWPWSSTAKLAIAYDYLANVAAAQNILASAWNQLRSAGIIMRSGQANDLEAWYAALWAYNTGIHPKDTNQPSAPWGLGWTNNPAGRITFNPNRSPFLKLGYEDAKEPGLWPYQERILGFAGRGFREGGDVQFATSEVPLTAAPFDSFCSAMNECDFGSAQPCTRADFKCWWHQATEWEDIECVALCPAAPSTPTFAAGTSEPGRAVPPYEAACTASPLPANAVIVDNFSSSFNRVGCPLTPNPGTFEFTYETDPDRPRVDLHQIGGSGYSGHFWFSHTVSQANSLRRITGTWSPPPTVVGRQHVYVHVPALGAESPQATYVIKTSANAPATSRVVNQRWNANTWIDLGVFDLSTGASVALSNVTPADYQLERDVDIAWDSVAFVPSGRRGMVYVAMGDSYQSGEGVTPYYSNSDVGGKTKGFTIGCHRSQEAYPAVIAQQLQPTEFHFLACSGAVIDNVWLSSTNSVSTVMEDRNEIPQMEQGYLTPQTNAVSIGIGGNDVGFADTVKQCELADCTGAEFGTSVLIEGLRQKYVGMFQEIRTRVAPDASIVAVGYPLLFSPTFNPVSLPCLPGFDAGEKAMVGRLGVQLNQVIEDAAAVAGIQFYDPNTRYTDNDRVCGSSEKINSVVLYSNDGDSPWNVLTNSYVTVPSRASFHPKESGHALIASDIARMLAPDYTPTDPTRIVDTRWPGNTPLAVGSTRQVQFDVPSGTKAVAVNLTAVHPAGKGYLTAYPCGTAVPLASNLNYYANVTVANQAIVKVDSLGRICVTASDASTHLLVDLVGYFEPTSTYAGLPPMRVYDGRAAPSPPTFQQIHVGNSTTLAAALNITAYLPALSGFVTVYPGVCNTPPPTASVLNYSQMKNAAAFTIARTDENGNICIVTSTPTRIIVDLNGLIPREGSKTMMMITPSRKVDTRTITPPILAPNTIRTIQLSPPSDALAAIVTVTTVNSQAGGFLTVFPCGTSTPNISNLNFTAGSTVANSAIVELSATSTICVVSSTTTHLLVDLQGYFTSSIPSQDT